MLVYLLLALAAGRGDGAAINCSNPIQASQAVDTVLSRRVDVDGDNSLDEVRLHISAPRFDQAFTRTITVISGGKTLLRRSSVDTQLDASIKTGTFGLPCGEYLRCKCEWYYSRIIEGVVLPAYSLGEAVFDSAATNSIYHVAAA